LDQERPNLCERHCVQDSQSVNATKPGALAAPVSTPMVVVVAPDPYVPPRSRLHAATLTAVVEPPPLVRFGVLRI
jgi:hypothetical protein